jgi:hypothetical protein
MYAGDTHELIVTVEKPDGTLADIGGSTVKWVAVRGRNIMIEKDSNGQGIELTDPNNGVFTVKLNPEDTRSLLGSLYHEALIIDSFGNETTVMVGSFKIIASFI